MLGAPPSVVTVVVRSTRTLAAMPDDVRLAEQALVAGLVLEPHRLAEVAGIVGPADFGSPVCGLLFGRLRDGMRAGAEGLPDLLRERGELRGDGYPLNRLVQWFDLVPPVASLPEYARLVVDGAVCRRVRQAGERLVQVAQTGRPEQCLRAVSVQRSVLLAERRRLSCVSWPHGDGSVRSGNAVRATSRVPVGADVVHAELVTVGAVVLAPAMARRLSWLRPADFAAADVARVFGRVLSMVRDGIPVDRVTVRDQLRRHGELPDVRAAALLAAAESAVPVAASAPYYARLVLAASIARQVGSAGHELRELGDHGRGGAADVVGTAIAALDVVGDLRARAVRACGSASARQPVRGAGRVVRPGLDRATQAR